MSEPLTAEAVRSLTGEADSTFYDWPATVAYENGWDAALEAVVRLLDAARPSGEADVDIARLIEQARLVAQWRGAIGSGPIAVLDAELAELGERVLRVTNPDGWNVMGFEPKYAALDGRREEG